MGTKCTFRVAEIPDPGTLGGDEQTAKVDAMIEDLLRQGWSLADWKPIPITDPCARTVQLALFFTRTDPPESGRRYIASGWLEQQIEGWRDKQAQKLNEEPKTGTISRSRLEGAVEAFEQVLRVIREAS